MKVLSSISKKDEISFSRKWKNLWQIVLLAFFSVCSTLGAYVWCIVSSRFISIACQSGWRKKYKGHRIPFGDDKREITNGVLNYVDIWVPLTFISYWQWHSNIAHSGHCAPRRCNRNWPLFNIMYTVSSGLAHMNCFIKPDDL